MSKPPGRPKSDDPKVAVTLRLRASVLARYKAEGEDWRGRMETALSEEPEPEAPFLSPAEIAHAAEMLTPGRMVRVLDDRAPGFVPLISRPPFNPQPKTGKAKR